MKQVHQLEIKINGYQEKIRELEAEITRLEQKHESLRLFKGNVETSQGEFHDIHNGWKNILAGVQPVEANSVTAQRYHAGMEHVLNGIASRIVTCVYPALLFEILVRMQKYINDITDCEAEIGRYWNLIGNAEEELQEAKKEEKNRRNGGDR